MMTIRRPRLLEWLEARAQSRLRAVIAPPGSGKTVLLKEYAHERGCTYVAVGSTRRMSDRFAASLCERLGLPAEAGLTTQGTIAALESMASCEIVIDEVDALRAEDRQSLAEIAACAPAHVRLIVGARCAEGLVTPRTLLDGSVAMLGAKALAFTAADVEALCTALQVRAEPEDVARLLRESEGWALAAAGAARGAAEASRTLENAMKLWTKERGGTLREMVLADAGECDLGATLVRLCTSEALVCVQDLQELERAGLYVHEGDRGLSLLKAVAAVFAQSGEPLAPCDLPDLAPMFVQLLGEFDVRIAGRRVQWVRRKDAMLFKYLLLEPLGRASRSELCERFWPTHDRQQASQNLRTTCCNIRAALRRCVPESRVDLYFSTAGRDIVLRNDLAITDLSRFASRMAAAREAMAGQRLDRAAEAYEAARALYRGPLIVDPPNDAHAAIARDVDESFNEIQRHLTALRRLCADSVPCQTIVA
ncbi:MAG: AAA family ATPase [Candidatus Tyrphobacter sp.]